MYTCFDFRGLHRTGNLNLFFFHFESYLVGAAVVAVELPAAEEEVVEDEDGDGVAPMKKSSVGSSPLPKCPS